MADWVFDLFFELSVSFEFLQVKMVAEAENDLIGNQFTTQSIPLLKLAKDQVKIILA